MVASFFAAVAYQWYVYYLVAYAIALRRIYYLEEAQKAQAPNKGPQTTSVLI
jgi:hypothetical protein